MKKWLIVLFILCLGSKSLGQVDGVTAVSAQETTPTQLQNDSVITFEQLGMSEIVLSGPQSSSRQVFGLPAVWRLTSGAELRLNFALFGLDDTSLSGTSVQEVTIEIELNDVVLEKMIVSTDGEQSVTIPIPDEALISTREDERHRLSFTIRSQEECLASHHPTAVIRDSSQLYLPHEARVPSTDLTKFPYPIFEQSFLPEAATIVVPTEPSAPELEAALHIAVGLGAMTNDAFQLSLVSESNLTADIQASQHIILVGKPDQLNALTELTLSAALQDNQFSLVEMEANDGLVQMAQSPWNVEKTVLLVSGHSDAGVAKAGQALSTGKIQTSSQRNIAIVADVQAENVYRTVVTTDQSLAQLGYDSQTIASSSSSAIEYVFQLPEGQVAASDAQLDLNIAHSSLLNYQTSGINITVNGQPVGSFILSEETAVSHIESIIIPAHILQPSTNHIRVSADLVPLSACSRLEDEGAWLTIYNNSFLHIPLAMQAAPSADNLFLSQYPQFLDLGSTLSQLAFVLPPNSPPIWQTATEMAFAMGRTNDIPLSDLAVTYANQVPDTIRQNRHLLLIGQPTTLPLLTEFNEMLPVPFEAGTNRPTENKLPLVYRLPTNISRGYLQLLPAPWTENRLILTVLGNTDMGAQLAATTLADNSLKAQLVGDFALLDDGQVFISDSRARVRQSLQPQVNETTQTVEESPAPVVNEEEISQAVVVSDGQPSWLLPGLIASIALIVLIVAYVIMSYWRQRHAS